MGSLRQTLPHWLEKKHYTQVIVLTDDNTQTHCWPQIQNLLPHSVKTITIPAGEQHKNLKTCEWIWNQMLLQQCDRKSLLINLGGGVIGDMGGFCAATWKRGIDFIQIPTTLLSMTDAAIGGKTGIDFQGIKNIIGVFQNPAAIFIDPTFLNTLAERELRSGFAEVIKHALIGSPVLLHKIHQSGNTPLPHLDWSELLRESIAVKIHVVAQDPTEQNLRMLLNFGHTIGHALESYFLDTDTPLTHGEAIAIGMICEIPKDKRAEVAKTLLRYFPVVPIPETAYPELWNMMLQDKKNSSGTVRMAVPDELPFTLNVLELSEMQLPDLLSEYQNFSPA
ncbi:MAG TPA: 3-dehydroquinate synthase [Saprospirales bacterium]|nr:3-dehydroquinate synthase [Saprospirales bacterium]